MSTKRDHTRIKFIRQGIKDLGMDEPSYRALYEGATGSRSISDMSNGDLLRVMDALRAAGFSPEGKGRSAVFKSNLYQHPQANKARSLWITLRDLGVLRDASEEALLSFVKRATGKAGWDWMDTADYNVLIEALKRWVRREERKAALRPANPEPPEYPQDAA